MSNFPCFFNTQKVHQKYVSEFFAQKITENLCNSALYIFCLFKLLFDRVSLQVQQLSAIQQQRTFYKICY